MATSRVLLLVTLFATANVQSKKCDGEDLYNCDIRLPQKEKNNACKSNREGELVENRKFYRLNNPKPFDDLTSPSLDQSRLSIVLKARLDDVDSTWFSVYYTMVSAFNNTVNELIKNNYLTRNLESFQDYKGIYEIFLKTSQSLHAPQYFSQPLLQSNFTDVTVGEIWRNDKYFVQRRLASQCAYYIRKVNPNFECRDPIGISKEYVMEHLNMDFNWNGHLSAVYNGNITLDEAIDKGLLFVLHHQEYNNLPKMADDAFDQRKMSNTPSPMTVFLLDDYGELHVVAIQINYTNNSPVFSPRHPDTFGIVEDNFDWLISKATVEAVDMTVCQLTGHLVQTHRTQEIFCNLFRRSMSSHHPLSQLMSRHCQGTSPVGALGLDALIGETGYSRKLFDIGNEGAKVLINKCYAKQSYEDADLPLQLRKQGLDDMHIKYYPYRDDGLLIWKEIKNFAAKYVNLYYKRNADVVKDYELQSFVNEVSADGNYTNGGKYKGFPAKFSTKSDVSKFLTRFIWLVVLHGANSYPLLPNGAYLPIAPTKLYYDPTTAYKRSLPDRLPNAAVTLTHEMLMFSLSSLRLNRLFDYWLHMSDIKGRKLVKSTFKRLNTCIQDKLNARNLQRFQNHDMTYQYMEPKFLPNSIHS